MSHRITASLPGTAARGTGKKPEPSTADEQRRECFFMIPHSDGTPLRVARHACSIQPVFIRYLYDGAAAQDASFFAIMRLRSAPDTTARLHRLLCPTHLASTDALGARQIPAVAPDRGRQSIGSRPELEQTTETLVPASRCVRVRPRRARVDSVRRQCASHLSCHFRMLL